jgi:hypothetical protein
MKNTIKKVAFIGSALLLSTAISSAQTTVSGNIDVGFKALKDNNTPAKSYNVMTKESQINVQTKGTLNNGLGYAAGFSIENDGNDLGAVGTHTENNYINFIAGNTTISLSADHMPNGNYTITNIVGGTTDIDDAIEGIAGTTIAAMNDTHGASASFGIGIIQDFGIAKASFFYAPSTTNDVVTNDGSGVISTVTGTGNAFKEITVRGNLGVTGLDAGLVYNWSETLTPGEATKTKDITNYLVSAKYSMGKVTGAVEQSENEASDGVTKNTRAYGLAYALTNNVVVGYQYANTDISNLVPNEKIQGINIGYNLGPVAVTAIAAKVSDYAGVANQDGKAFHINATAKF